MTLTAEKLRELEKWVSAKLVEEGLCPPELQSAVRLRFDGDERIRRPGKDWNACPYESHADDCNCGGAGGNR